MATDSRVVRLTLAEWLETSLRVDIIEGKFVPGQRLKPADLAQQYGVSQAPLREGLQRLAARGMVEFDPRTGVTVADISLTDVRDIYAMRQLLESMALEQSLSRADAAFRERLQLSWDAFQRAAAAVQALDTSATDATLRSTSVAFAEGHRAFHEALFSACDSPWLMRFVETLYDQSERYRTIHAEHVAHSITEHGNLFKPAFAGRRKEAVAALKRHLAGAVETIEAGLANNAQSSEPAA